MGREGEELPLLGDGGEAPDILLRSSRSKLVRTLSFTLLLPLSFATLVLCLIPSPLVLYNSNYENISYFVGETINPVDFPVGTWTLYTINGVFELWMLSTAAVMYTVASIYTFNEVCFENEMTVLVPRAWKRLALTLLWFFTIVLVHTTAYIMAFLLLIYTVGIDKYVNSREFLETIPMLGVFLCVLVYINMVGYLASTIYLLQEQYYSLPAMLKRRRLIKVKRTTVLSLVMLYFIFSQGSGIFCYTVAYGNASRGEWILGRAVYSTFLCGLLCLVMFWGLLMETEV